jgi:(R,R)-butanediol dehydrogenase/meso-butanediol dehydrogenase/diacetyl reductase
MAEAAVVEEYQVSPLPRGVGYEQAALIEPAAVATNAVERAGIKAGDTVLVTGAGPIGALSVLAARAAGASQVFLSEPNDNRARRAAALGADAILSPIASEVSSELRAGTAGGGVDVSIECSGNAQALATCLASTRARGTVAQVGLHVKAAPIDAWDLTFRELSLVGVYAFSLEGFARIPEQIDAGTFPIDRIVTSTIALEDVVQKGFDALLDPSEGEIKILVDVG